MKIASQSPDELVLQEGYAPGIAIGIVAIVGVLAAFFLHSSKPIAL